MSLRSVPVSQCLEKKLRIFGFEVPDILATFITLSVLNFIFGQAHSKLMFVWLPSLALAAVLYFGKKGKPDNYLVHWLRFQVKPGIFSAFDAPTDWVSPPRTKRKEGKQS